MNRRRGTQMGRAMNKRESDWTEDGRYPSRFYKNLSFCETAGSNSQRGGDNGKGHSRGDGERVGVGRK